MLTLLLAEIMIPAVYYAVLILFFISAVWLIPSRFLPYNFTALRAGSTLALATLLIAVALLIINRHNIEPYDKWVYTTAGITGGIAVLCSAILARKRNNAYLFLMIINAVMTGLARGVLLLSYYLPATFKDFEPGLG